MLKFSDCCSHLPFRQRWVNIQFQGLILDPLNPEISQNTRKDGSSSLAHLERNSLVVGGQHTAHGLSSTDGHGRLLHHHLRGIGHLGNLAGTQLAVLDVGSLALSDPSRLNKIASHKAARIRDGIRQGRREATTSTVTGTRNACCNNYVTYASSYVTRTSRRMHIKTPKTVGLRNIVRKSSWSAMSRHCVNT